MSLELNRRGRKNRDSKVYFIVVFLISDTPLVGGKKKNEASGLWDLGAVGFFIFYGYGD